MKKKGEPNVLLPAARPSSIPESVDYGRLVADIAGLLDRARRTAARSVNGILTATYWEIGRRIVEYEQKGRERAPYGERLLATLSKDLKTTHGRGFSQRNLEQMRSFYVGWEISQTPSAQLVARVRCEMPGTEKDIVKPVPQVVKSPELRETFSIQSADLGDYIAAFPLSWSHYVELMSVANYSARAFYESEAIQGGWSVRQLDRQISTRFYERGLGSKNRGLFLAKGRQSKAEDVTTVEEEIRDPYLLEFLNLKDEYSESALEEALIRHLQWFLLEMGTGFTFVGRQKRIRIGDSWYRMDLLLYHRRLRCLVIVDLKRGKFSHADAGQMSLYLNYAKEHLTMPGEADPVGIILCGRKNEAVVKYALGGIKAKVFASEYLTLLPDEETLRQEILKTRRLLEARQKEGKLNA